MTIKAVEAALLGGWDTVATHFSCGLSVTHAPVIFTTRKVSGEVSGGTVLLSRDEVVCIACARPASFCICLFLHGEFL